MSHPGAAHDGNEDVVASADDGDPLWLAYRVVSHTNAEVMYYLERFPVFVHTFDDTGETVMLLDGEFLDRVDEERAARARDWVEGTPLSLEHPNVHHIRRRVDSDHEEYGPTNKRQPF